MAVPMSCVFALGRIPTLFGLGTASSSQSCRRRLSRGGLVPLNRRLWNKTDGQPIAELAVIPRLLTLALY